MREVRQTLAFREWLEALRDAKARQRIAQRIVRLQAGLFGDAKFSTGSANSASITVPAIASTSSNGVAS